MASLHRPGAGLLRPATACTALAFYASWIRPQMLTPGARLHETTWLTSGKGRRDIGPGKPYRLTPIPDEAEGNRRSSCRTSPGGKECRPQSTRGAMHRDDAYQSAEDGAESAAGLRDPAALLYAVAHDALAAILYQNYSPFSQTISELGSIGAPPGRRSLQ